MKIPSHEITWENVGYNKQQKFIKSSFCLLETPKPCVIDLERRKGLISQDNKMN